MLRARATLRKATTGAEYEVRCEIQEIPYLELDIAGGGLVMGGGTRGFFLPCYEIEGVEVEVEEGDEIVFQERTYSVVSVTKHTAGGTAIYLEAELQLV